jgi:hypothetical protein
MPALLAFSRSAQPFCAQKHLKNTHSSRNNSTKMLGFSCFCMVLAGRLFEIGMVKPRRFSSASLLSQKRPAIPAQNSLFCGLMTILVLQVRIFSGAPSKAGAALIPIPYSPLFQIESR